MKARADAPIAGGNIDIHLRIMRASENYMTRQSTLRWVVDVMWAHGFQLYGVFSARPCLNFAEMPSDRLPLLHPQFAPRLALATEQNRLQEEVFSEARSIGFHRAIDNPVRLRSANSLR